jgi:hypothetical protein
VLNAYCIGVHRPQGPILIIVDHYFVNRGLAVLQLNGWFFSMKKVGCEIVTVGAGAQGLYPSTFAIFRSLAASYACSIDDINRELLVFWKAVTGHFLVNLQPGDDALIETVIQQYVFWFSLKLDKFYGMYSFMGV